MKKSILIMALMISTSSAFALEAPYFPHQIERFSPMSLTITNFTMLPRNYANAVIARNNDPHMYNFSNLNLMSSATLSFGAVTHTMANSLVMRPGAKIIMHHPSLLIANSAIISGTIKCNNDSAGSEHFISQSGATITCLSSGLSVVENQ